MQAGIMATPTVDVRDMLCAQALAVVARAVDAAVAGEALEVRYNTDDVKRDLVHWARDRGVAISEDGPMRLRIQR